MSSAYNTDHVSFVSTETGTTSIDVLFIWISTSLLAYIAILLLPITVSASALNFKLTEGALALNLNRFVVEFFLLAVGSLLVITVFADPTAATSYWTGWITLLLLLIFLLILSVLNLKKDIRTTFTWKNVPHQQVAWLPHKGDQNEVASSQTKRRAYPPFLTISKSWGLYLTLLSILAVDFPIFPRRYAKTKVYGVSLMDIGTACFIMQNGTFAPEARDRRPNLRKALGSSVPLVVLGLARFLTVKGTDYHQVTEEYGVHWNFFLTLAAVKLLGAVATSVINPKNSLKLAITIALCYEATLVLTDLQESYLLNPTIDRALNLINANREGIFSSIGYFALYLSGITIGQGIFRDIEHRKTVKDWIKYTIRTFKHVAMLWILYNITSAVNQPCRRIANLSYILWSLACYQTLLSFQCSFDIALSVIQSARILCIPQVPRVKGQPSVAHQRPVNLVVPPYFFEALNYNGLAMFLIANVLTGSVNFLVHTVYASQLVSLCWMIAYAAALYLIACGLYYYRIQLKWW